MSSDLSTIILKPTKERSLKRFHPWVFSGAIEKMPSGLAAGDLVRIKSHSGEALGVGYTGDGGSIAVKMLEFSVAELKSDWLEQRLAAAFRLRQNLGLLSDPNTNACRLVHAEGDGLPGLIIDRYFDLALIQLHTQGMTRLAPQIEGLIRKLLSSSINNVFVRSADREQSEDERLIDIKENGHTFKLNYSSGQKTGFFLDQRENRGLLKRLAHGRKVLNCFSFSGAFSVYALAGQAVQVDSVDASKPALKLCDQNILSNFGASTAHRSIAADCFQFLQEIKDRYDLIVLDPPAFAKHRNAIQGALDGYRTINRLAIGSIKPAGLIFTFSCSQLISRSDFREVVFSAAAMTGRKVRVLYDLHQGPDHPVSIYHPEGEYLKGLVLEVQ